MRTYSYRALTLAVLFALAAIGAGAKTWKVGSELLNDRFGSQFGSGNLGYDPDEASRTINELINIDGIDSVEIRVVQGNVNVAREPGGSIVIKGRAIGAQEFVDGLELKSERRGNTIVYEASYVQPGQTGQRGRTDVNVAVPDGVSVTAHSDAGEVSITGVRADVAASTTFGMITVSGTRGNLDASTSAGAIEVESAEITGRVTLSNTLGELRFDGTLGETNTFSTDSGAVYVKVPASTCVSIDASVAAGEISSSLPVSSLVKNGPRAVASGQLGTGTPTGALSIAVGVGEVNISAR